MKNRNICPLCGKPLPRHSNGRIKPCPCTFRSQSDYDSAVDAAKRKAFEAYSITADRILAGTHSEAEMSPAMQKYVNSRRHLQTAAWITPSGVPSLRPVAVGPWMFLFAASFEVEKRNILGPKGRHGGESRPKHTGMALVA